MFWLADSDDESDSDSDSESLAPLEEDEAYGEYEGESEYESDYDEAYGWDGMTWDVPQAFPETRTPEEYSYSVRRPSDFFVSPIPVSAGEAGVWSDFKRGRSFDRLEVPTSRRVPAGY